MKAVLVHNITVYLQGLPTKCKNNYWIDVDEYVWRLDSFCIENMSNDHIYSSDQKLTDDWKSGP